MREKLHQISEEIKEAIIQSRDDAENFRMKYLSRKGLLAGLFEDFKKVPKEDRRDVGQLLNQIKIAAEEKFNEIHAKLTKREKGSEGTELDLSLPGEPAQPGSRHPLMMVQNRIVDVFSRLGFVLAEGPEIEDDWHNFSGLNFPENHPARDMQDTFFVAADGLEKEYALRTHTSSVQVRLMETTKPPIRAIMPGRVYRNEAISARAHCFFHQVEGIFIDTDVSFADLKQTLYYFVKEMFGEDFKIRFRPSFFPFTEPSAEMDISCMLCKGKGCNVCKYTGWVEILGCGMVDPDVLKANEINPDENTGFAFGMGIERIAMLLYDVKDLRLFSNNDIRFLSQFRGT